MLYMKQFIQRLRDDKLFTTVVLAVLSLFVLTLLWILVVPLRAVPSEIDYIISLLPVPIFLLVWGVLAGIIRSSTDMPRKKMRFLLIAVCGVFLMPNLFFGVLRTIARKSCLESCEGKVTERYVSDNHGALSIVVTGPSSIRMEGINEAFYDVVTVGDDVLKEPWSDYALINGHPRRIVEFKGWWPMSKGIASYSDDEKTTDGIIREHR